MHPTTTIFTLASGRSGTHYLYQLIRRNAGNCIARHETYGFNPSMFGRPIYDHVVGEKQRTRRLLGRKRRIIERFRAAAYIETSHAFLKSWHDLAPEFFPRMKLVRLIRDPLKVAKSEAYREALIKRLRVPFCHYGGGDGRRYFLWSLTGQEPIFRHLDGMRLTPLQWYLVQWIEIENRAMQFLNRFAKHADCFTVQSPADLNDPAKMREMFDFLGLTPRHDRLGLAGRQNKNWRPTIIHDEDRQQFAALLGRLPASYLDIFRGEPYTSLPGNPLQQFLAPGPR